MQSVVYLIGSEGYIGTRLQTLLPPHRLIRIGNPRKHYADPGVLSSLPDKVPPDSTAVLLAAVAGEKACEENRQLAYETNVELVKRVCELDFSKIVLTSTASVYAVTDSCVNEASEVTATSYYTETKLQAEEIVLSRNGHNIVARLAVAMGVAPKTDWSQLVNFMMKSALEGKPIDIYGPNSFRPYYDVSDIARGILTLLDVTDFNGQIINVGSTALNYTKLGLAEAVKELVPELNYSVSGGADKRSYQVSFARFEEKYQPGMTLRDTLANLKEYHRISLSN